MDIYEQIRIGKWVEAGRNNRFQKQPDGVYVKDGYALYRNGKLIDRCDSKSEANDYRKHLARPDEITIISYGGGKITPEMLRKVLQLPDTFDGIEKAIQSFKTLLENDVKNGSLILSGKNLQYKADESDYLADLEHKGKLGKDWLREKPISGLDGNCINTTEHQKFEMDSDGLHTGRILKRIPRTTHQAKSFNELVAEMIETKQGFGKIVKFIRNYKKCSKREAEKTLSRCKQITER